MNCFLLRSDCCHCAWLVISKNWFPYVPSLDPFWWLYLRHVSGIFGLRWCRSVFTSCVWAQEQPSHHSSLVTSSFKSVLKACRILFEDSLHLLTNRLYNKYTRPLACEGFKVLSYGLDRGGGGWATNHCTACHQMISCTTASERGLWLAGLIWSVERVILTPREVYPSFDIWRVKPLVLCHKH